MNISEITLLTSAIISAAVAVGAIVRDRRRSDVDEAQTRHFKTDEDQIRAQIKQMSEQTNRKRDFRIWQLEGYIDLDRTWHRVVVDILEDLKEDGHLPTGTVVPLAPEIPQPID